MSRAETRDKKGRRLPNTLCPTCEYEVDAAMCIGGTDVRPSVGDITLCLKCGEILIFDEDMKVRLPLVVELMNLPPHTEHTLTIAQETIRRERPIK